MELFRIEFASWITLLKRRLETLAIVSIFTLHLFSPFMAFGFLFYILFYTKLWWLSILYLVWCYLIDTDPCESSKRRSDWVRSWTVWQFCRNYFPTKVSRGPSKELEKDRNYIICFFPHGFLSSGMTLNFISNNVEIKTLFPDHTVYVHTLDITFQVPFFRELVYSVGGLPSSKRCINFAMGKRGGGNISCLAVGGAEEAFHFNPGIHKIVLKNRRGFIKIALRNGCSLIPAYSFGENEILSQVKFEEGTLMRKFQSLVKKWTTVALIFVKGRGLIGILPHRRPINVVVGEPIDVQKTENPTQEQIDNLHQLFEKKLVELFETQKKYYLEDHETAHLEIV